MIKPIKLASVGAVVMLFGCASVDPMNTPERIQPLISAFNEACQKAAGSIGKPTAQGSYGLCQKDGVTADLYIHRDFVLVNSVRPYNAYASAQRGLSDFCSSEKGEYTSSLRASGGRFVQDPDGKETCKSTEWMAQVQAPANPSTRQRETSLNVSVKRTEGRAPAKYLELAVRVTTSK